MFPKFQVFVARVPPFLATGAEVGYGVVLLYGGYVAQKLVWAVLLVIFHHLLKGGNSAFAV